MTPAYGKDWNERLVYSEHPEKANQPERDKQTLQLLWRWHQVARELGKSERYLARITEVARACNKGELLSERAKTAMRQDFQGSQKSLMQPSLGLEDLPGKSQKKQIEVDQ